MGGGPPASWGNFIGGLAAIGFVGVAVIAIVGVVYLFVFIVEKLT